MKSSGIYQGETEGKHEEGNGNQTDNEIRNDYFPDSNANQCSKTCMEYLGYYN
jgi:hypothetical protein